MTRQSWLAGVLAIVLLSFMCRGATAHEVRPAYLELKETAPGRFETIWRTPMLAGMRLPVTVKFPDDARDLKPTEVTNLSDSVVERHWIEAGKGTLEGSQIRFPGLQLTITDVLVRLEHLDGSRILASVHPSQPWLEVPARRGGVQTAKVFFSQGVWHILFGTDHLLFVFGLLLLVRNPLMLLKTVTAFTVAHSITLALATLGYVSLPVAPLEAAIALSIVFLGVEVVRSWRSESSFTIRHPWVAAFAFGLLHGFGFASGLAAIGLPSDDIALALLFFNVGVEFGQLAFLTLVLAFAWTFRSIKIDWPRPVQWAPAYVVGGLGAFWAIGRIVAVFAGTT